MQGFGRAMFAAAALALCGTAAATDETTIGISLEGSTLGAGLSVGMPLGDSFNVRGVYHGYTYDTEFEDDSGGTYDGELDLKSTGLFADWHPFKGAFRVTVGFLSNGNQINLSGTDDGTGLYEVGDCTYQSNPGDPLTLDGTTEFNSSAPYVGIGWGGNLNAEPGFFMTFDLGVMMSGAPETALAADGSVTNANEIGQPGCGIGPIDSSDAVFQDELRQAEDEVNKETEDYELWPNIAIGIGWRF
jgi:hypothetical protein